MFYTPIRTILLVIIHSSKNKMEEVDGFAVMFDWIYLSHMANNFQMAIVPSTGESMVLRATTWIVLPLVKNKL